MASQQLLPAHLASLAERSSWFSSDDALKVLDWLDQENWQFLGFDSALRQSDGTWMLLLDPILDLSHEADAANGFAVAKKLITENQNLMFDLVYSDSFE